MTRGYNLIGLSCMMGLALLLASSGCGRFGAGSGADPARAPGIASFEVGKVTYLTLSPDVDLSLTLENGSGRARAVTVEYSIEELVKGRVKQTRTEKLRLRPGRHERRVTLPLRLDRMLGLLARARVLDPASGRVLAEAERPFDATNDLRTNFRYAGETYGGVVEKLTPTYIAGGKTPDDFWDHIPIEVGPEEEIALLRRCYQNVAQVSVEEDRGHYTCWQEGNRKFWTKSAYLANDIWRFSLDRLNYLYHEGQNLGVYMMPWTDGKGARQTWMDKSHPWIDKANPTGYYPGSWLMNQDPNFRHPLTPEEQKLTWLDLHGATNWLDYVSEDIFIMSRFYQPRMIWWDNSYGWNVPIEYTLDRLRNKWADTQPGAEPPLLMINGDAAYHSDVYWIEHNLPDRMAPYVALLKKLIEDRPAVKRGAATIFSGQHHPSVTSGQQQGITDPKNFYNDPACAFMFRQLLFEALATDARIVGQQQWPRNALEWRIKHFPEAFREHAKSWGFQTQFEHVYNARDVAPYPLAEQIRVTNAPATYEGAVEDGKLHLVARAPLSDPDTIYLHLFNYVGTTTNILAKRARPARQESVALHVTLPGFAREYRVRAFSPDFERFSDRLEPKSQCKAAEIEFSVPVDTYTLVVIDKPWR